MVTVDVAATMTRGAAVGALVGTMVGAAVGTAVGALVGSAVGASVGTAARWTIRDGCALVDDGCDAVSANAAPAMPATALPRIEIGISRVMFRCLRFVGARAPLTAHDAPPKRRP